MSVEIRVADKISEEERRQLFGWGTDIFGAASLNLHWRPKDWHVFVYMDGRAVSHVGLLKHTVEVGGRRVTVGGVGGVVSVPDVQGRGFATRALHHAESFMRDELAADFGLLFCFDRLVPFYRRLGWRPVREPVEVDQPAGRITSPLNVLVLPCRGQDWPPGAISLESLPW